MAYPFYLRPISSLNLVKMPVVSSMMSLGESVQKWGEASGILVVDRVCPVGIILAKNLVEKAFFSDMDVHIPIADIMSRRVVCCQARDNVRKVIDLMQLKKVEHVIVYDGDQLLGVVDARVLLGHMLRLGEKRVFDDVSSKVNG